MSKLVFIKIKTHHGTEFDDLSDGLKSYLLRKYPEDTVEQYNSNAGLVPEMGRVVCVTLGYDADPEPVTVTFTGGMSEHELLMNLAHLLERVKEMDYQLAGWNNNHFDAVYLMKRYLINRIKVPTLLYNSLKWVKSMERNPDIMDIWRLGENAVPLELAALSVGDEFSERYDTSQLKLNDIDFNRLKSECENDVKSIIKLNGIINKYLW